MQMKNTRGVQQTEVWAAADTLLAEGVRPTIERVRQQLGRGSPNTVAPMLEAWFADLGRRLGLRPDAKEEGTVPPALVTALADLWGLALKSARQTLDEQAATGRAELAAQVHRLRTGRK